MANPKKLISAYSASCSTGGIFRGHARGNTFNIADASDVWEDINLHADNMVEKPEKGKIHFYISNLSLAKVDVTQSSFTTTIHDISKCQTCGSQNYSSICHKQFIFICYNLFKFQ